MILSAPVRGARAANQGLTSAASWLLALAPAACITRGSPKGCRSEPSPVPSPGLAFVCPLYEPPIRRGVRGLPDTLPQVPAHTTVRSPEVGNIRNRAASVRVSWWPYHAAPSSRLYKATGASSAPGARGRVDGALLHQFLGSSHLLRMTGSNHAGDKQRGPPLSDNMGSCRRSFDAKVRRKQSFATNRWLLSFGPFHGSRCRAWQDHAVKLTTLNVHMISNGGLLCSGNTGSCRRSFDAPVRRKLHFATCCRLTLFGPFQRSRCRLCRLFLATHDKDCACGQFTGSFAPRALAPAIGPSG